MSDSPGKTENTDDSDAASSVSDDAQAARDRVAEISEEAAEQERAIEKEAEGSE